MSKAQHLPIVATVYRLEECRSLWQRELEHERLIEAYREKMLLYDDLSALRKEKLRGKKKSATWFR
ncbi:hypothetical protein ANCCAN_11687 [Ancylostoma caninum]|uniref:Uncharacterized protein n=1 Tax=Ancylostoma caninum TaxID=29170 RepID=A0A368GDB5_ANCCA|nr:hypothetical protein ANCCAN_11687 [Ancylostoma caninum]